MEKYNFKKGDIIVIGHHIECPCCGEWINLDDIDMETYKKKGSIPIECYECSTIFYLEK